MEIFFKRSIIYISMPGPMMYRINNNQAKIVMSAKLKGPDLTIIESYITTIVHVLNQEGYKYIGWAYDHDPDPQDGERQLVLIIVLDESTDEEELKNKALGQIDDTIEWAKPHVLEGLDVWELWAGRVRELIPPPLFEEDGSPCNSTQSG
jgi:hypothetical protein